MGTVLVIDDEYDVRLLCRLNLSQTGIEVRQAASGDDGLRSARESPPDVVVLDLMMPGLDGFEVLRRLRADARTSQVPVLVLSAMTRDSDRAHCLELGADAFMTKPFEMDALAEAVQDLAQAS